jgi:hypothetical protein
VWGAGKSAQSARGGSSVRRAVDFSIPGVDEEEAWFRHGNDQEDQDQEVEKKKEKKKKEKKKKGDGAVNGAATDTTTVVRGTFTVIRIFRTWLCRPCRPPSHCTW